MNIHPPIDLMHDEAQRIDARELDGGITSDALIKATNEFHKAAWAFVAAANARGTLRRNPKYSLEYFGEILSEVVDDDYGALVLNAFEAACDGDPAVSA